MAARGAVEVHVDGLADFRRDLKRLDPLIDRELRDAIREGAAKATITAGAFAPRRSGDLAHSLRAFVSGARASIGSTLPYAGVVHWGGVIEPRGVPIRFERTEFISRAIADHADEIVEDIADGIDRAAYRAGWHPGR